MVEPPRLQNQSIRWRLCILSIFIHFLFTTSLSNLIKSKKQNQAISEHALLSIRLQLTLPTRILSRPTIKASAHFCSMLSSLRAPRNRRGDITCVDKKTKHHNPSGSKTNSHRDTFSSNVSERSTNTRLVKAIEYPVVQAPPRDHL